MRSFLLHSALVLMVVGLVACRPKGVLSSRDMSALLFDIHLVDALTDGSYGPLPATWTGPLVAEQFKDLAYQQVLKKHGVTEVDFFASVAYYSKNLRLYTRIYSDVDKHYRAYIEAIESGSFHEQTAQSLKEALGKDSLRMRALYERWHVLPDTLSRLSNTYRPDSVTSWLTYQTERWLRPYRVEAQTFLVVDTVTLNKGLLSPTDSVPQATAADTGSHEAWAIKLLHGEVAPDKQPVTSTSQPTTTVSPTDRQTRRQGNLPKPRISRRVPTSNTP